MLIESLGVFVHFGNALWNPYRLTNGQKINVFQIMNGVLALSALIALIVGGILLFTYPNSGAEMVVVFAFVAVFLPAPPITLSIPYLQLPNVEPIQKNPPKTKRRWEKIHRWF